MKAYSRIIVYFFSGTGNSMNVAHWISEIASNDGIECHLYDITICERRNIVSPPDNSLIFFISPVHGFNYPPVMIQFILHFPKGNNKAVLMNTRAGMLIGKYVTPGCSGISLYFSALVLKLKNYRIKGLIPVDLPSNWLSVHPGLNDRTIQYLYNKNKEKISRKIHGLIEGGSNFKSVREILQDAIVAPFSLAYYFIGRFLFSKTYYTSSDCNHCNLCIRNCPVKAIKEVDQRPFWTYKCESCMRCMNACPQRSIETAHGFVIAFGFIFSYWIADPCYLLLDHYNIHIKDTFTAFILESAVFILFLAIAYRLMHLLMRFKSFEKMMVYTSLTKYKWWGRRYKAPKTDKNFKT